MRQRAARQGCTCSTGWRVSPGGGARAWREWRGRRSRTERRRLGHRRGGLSRGRGDDGCSLRRGRRLGQPGSRRVEQQRVLAHQPAGSPVGFENHVDEGFEHRTVARHAQHLAAIRALLQNHLCRGQHRVVFDPGSAVSLGRRDSQPQRRQLFRRDVRYFDLGAQGLAQRRLHVEPPQAQRPGLRSPQASGGQRHPSQRKARRVSRAVFQGVSQNVRRRLMQRSRHSSVRCPTGADVTRRRWKHQR